VPSPYASVTTPLGVLVVGPGPLADPGDGADAALRAAGFDASWVRARDADELTTALAAPAAQGTEVVLCTPFTDGGGLSLAETVRRVRGRVPHAPLIVIVEQVGREDLPTLLHAGVTDVLFADELDRLGLVVAAALAKQWQARRDLDARSRHHQWAVLLSGLVHHAPAAICVRDRSGDPMVMNSRYEALAALGLAPLPPVTGRHPVGSVVELAGTTLMAFAFPVTGAAGLAVAHGEILMDISEQKAIEAQLLVARAELERQADELRASNADLVELDRLKTDLVSTVSHELRTPLTSILGYTELLTDELTDRPDGEVDTGTLRMVEVISRNSSRLLGLIDNLLVLARLDGIDPAAGSSVAASADSEPVDLAVLVEHVVTTLGPSAATAGLDLVTERPEAAAVVTGDAEQLERAVLNLASNAVKFSTRGGTVTLAVRIEDDQVVVEVRDRGIGIAADELPRLGTRFFRSESARVEQVQGSGLGLSVVHGIASRHGGTFEIESELCVGTVARLRLIRQRERAG
jgi:signal transduction histidine kinase